MNYAYERVSTQKQDADNQKFEIDKFCASNKIHIDKYVVETVSGGKDFQQRKLGELLNEMQEGDLLICTEISRLARSVYQVFDILKIMSEKGIRLRTIKDNFELNSSIQSKVLAFCFSLSAEIEKSMISSRTREALAAKKAAGVKLGRPKGALSKKTKLTGKEEVIQVLLDNGNSYAEIARVLKVDRSTLSRFCKSRALNRTVSCNENS